MSAFIATTIKLAFPIGFPDSRGETTTGLTFMRLMDAAIDANKGKCPIFNMPEDKGAPCHGIKDEWKLGYVTGYTIDENNGETVFTAFVHKDYFGTFDTVVTYAVCRMENKKPIAGIYMGLTPIPTTKIPA